MTSRSKLSNRSIRSVLISDIYEIRESSDVSNPYLHGAYVYLVKRSLLCKMNGRQMHNKQVEIAGSIKSKHSMPGTFTEYVVMDESHDIKCKIYNEDSDLLNFEEGDKVTLIGKIIIDSNNETKIGVHHMALNQTESSDFHCDEIKYLKTKRKYDELISKMKQNQPFLYEQYIRNLSDAHGDYQRGIRAKINERNLQNQQQSNYYNDYSQSYNQKRNQSENNQPGNGYHHTSSDNQQSNRIMNNYNYSQSNGQNQTGLNSKNYQNDGDGLLVKNMSDQNVRYFMV